MMRPSGIGQWLDSTLFPTTLAEDRGTRVLDTAQRCVTIAIDVRTAGLWPNALWKMPAQSYIVELLP
jgi:hypothetical protein